jgi:hypothetical protein
MANILLTGGRAPVTLDLARAFHRAGHSVFMAESLRGHLSQPSNAYSRFASRTLILPALREALSMLTFDRTWIAQQFVAGRQFCSYSVSQHGRIVAHVVYPAIFTAGQGATISFQAVEHEKIFHWVHTFASHFNVTGQMAFDFIESPDGEAYVLECNPRATSGVHLLASNPRFVESFFDPRIECVRPTSNSPRMLGTAMLVYGLPDALKKRMAERAGFEPATGFKPGTHLAGEPIQPLWHLPNSMYNCSI